MQFFLLGKQFITALYPVGVGDTTIHRTNSGTLGFIVKAHAFGAFVRYDEIIIGLHRFVALVGIDHGAIFQGIGPIDRIPVADGPFDPAFINRIIGALRFTGAAIDAFVGYSDCHNKFSSLTPLEVFWFGKYMVKHGAAGEPFINPPWLVFGVEADSFGYGIFGGLSGLANFGLQVRKRATNRFDLPFL